MLHQRGAGKMGTSLSEREGCVCTHVLRKHNKNCYRAFLVSFSV